MLSDFLATTTMLDKLDISHNLIREQSCVCLAAGIAMSKSIQSINFEGNPIGVEGREALMRARN